jgi:hypothetical protein
MGRQVLTLMLVVSFELGCGGTWGRPSAVEVPLHRHLLGLNPNAPPCTLERTEWEKRCNREGFGHPEICPKGCPPSEPETDSDEE